MLSGAFPGRDVLAASAQAHRALHAERDLAVRDAVSADLDNVLPARRQRREGHLGPHSASVVLRLQLTHRREHAG